MAYQRRHSTQSRSEEDHHLTSPTVASPLPTLSPPRPFFTADRGSYSDTSNEGSDSDRDPVHMPVAQPAQKQRNHRRRSQMSPQAAPGPQYSPDPETPGVRDPFVHQQDHQQQEWSPTALYDDNRAGRGAHRAPPSAFAFPFQAHPGNPDPGTAIPGVSRRSSVDSIRRPTSAGPEGTSYATAHNGYGNLPLNSPSVSELAHETDLGRPYAPFMGPGGAQHDGSSEHSRRSSFNSVSQGEVYGRSAAAAMQGSSPMLGQHPDLPRVSSVGTFRAPFLSPASRPSSTFWAPPSYPYGAASPGSGSAVALNVQKHKPPMPSTRIAAKLTAEEKPWINDKDGMGRLSWWITMIMLLLGTGIGAVICWRGYEGVYLLEDSDLCLVMNDQFTGGSLDETLWSKDIQMGGFGNGEFEATTGDSKNIYVKNGQLYLMPTLTSDDVGADAIFDGGSLDLGDDCTEKDFNVTACSASSSKDSGSVLPPVKSARINTAGHKTIAFGKVEVRAKLPRGDWLWPAIWMLPADVDPEQRHVGAYGQWPMSGEIDIMEARGNNASYKEQGNNVARSSLNYGILQGVQARLFGWQQFKRQSLAEDFHTYTLEWSRDWIRMSIDTRLHSMLTFNNKKKSFYDRGGFPKIAKNGTDTDVVIQNIWEKGKVPAMAPFDQEFYLIINLAAGGTSGWFPDGVGGKPWYDGSATAMRDFAVAQDQWSKTWPKNDADRAFRIDSVKMWKLKTNGRC